MRIVVVSDSHNNERIIEKAKEAILDSDVLLFLGDGEEDLEGIKEWYEGEVYAVSGNCDFTGKNPMERVIELEGVKIFMCHGHKYNVKYGYTNISYRGEEIGADIVLFGHSHIPMIEREKNILLINPGSLSHSIGRIRNSIAYIEIENGCVNDVYIKEI